MSIRLAKSSTGSGPEGHTEESMRGTWHGLPLSPRSSLNYAGTREPTHECKALGRGDKMSVHINDAQSDPVVGSFKTLCKRTPRADHPHPLPEFLTSAPAAISSDTSTCPWHAGITLHIYAYKHMVCSTLPLYNIAPHTAHPLKGEMRQQLQSILVTLERGSLFFFLVL